MITNNMFLLSSVKNDPLLFYNYLLRVYRSLSYLNAEYPFFREWYFNKVYSGVIKGERDIILARHKHAIIGVAIVKNTTHERKICTLRVSSKFRRNNVGKALFLRSMDVLDCENPVITVSDKRVAQFSPLLRYYGYKLTEVRKGYYSDKRAEYVYNGALQSH